jgi:hypothetical protein
LRVFVDHELCHLIVVCLFSGQVRHPDLLDGHIGPFRRDYRQPKYRVRSGSGGITPFQVSAMQCG